MGNVLLGESASQHLEELDQQSVEELLDLTASRKGVPDAFRGLRAGGTCDFVTIQLCLLSSCGRCGLCTNSDSYPVCIG